MTPARGGVAERTGRIDPRIRQRRIEVTRRQGRRRLRLLVGALALVVALAGVWMVLHSSLFAARVLRVTGSAHTPAARVLAAAGLSRHPPLLDVDPGAAAAAVERLPWVATASVRREWPDGVVVVVHERTPVAAVDLGAAGAAGPWAEIDKTGRVLADVPTAPPHMVHLVASGTMARPGGRVGTVDHAGLVVAATLPPAFAAQVTQVTVGTGGDVRLQLTSPVTVDLGSTTQLRAKYEAVAAVLAGAPLTAGDVIDVTVPASPHVDPG